MEKTYIVYFNAKVSQLSGSISVNASSIQKAKAELTDERVKQELRDQIFNDGDTLDLTKVKVWRIERV